MATRQVQHDEDFDPPSSTALSTEQLLARVKHTFQAEGVPFPKVLLNERYLPHLGRAYEAKVAPEDYARRIDEWVAQDLAETKRKPKGRINLASEATYDPDDPFGDKPKGVTAKERNRLSPERTLLHVSNGQPEVIGRLALLLKQQRLAWADLVQVMSRYPPRMRRFGDDFVFYKKLLLGHDEVWTNYEHIKAKHARWIAERFAKACTREKRVPTKAECPHWLQFAPVKLDLPDGMEPFYGTIKLEGLPPFKVSLHDHSLKTWPVKRVVSASVYLPRDAGLGMRFTASGKFILDEPRSRDRRPKKIDKTDWHVNLGMDMSKPFVVRKPVGRPRTQLSESIMVLHRQGYTKSAIARQTKLNRRTVIAVISRAENSGTL